MHQNILIQPEMPDIIPAEYLVLGQSIAIVNTFLMISPRLLVNKVRYQHVDLLTLILQITKQSQNLAKSLSIHPVITVHYLKIFPPGRT